MDKTVYNQNILYGSYYRFNYRRSSTRVYNVMFIQFIPGDKYGYVHFKDQESEMQRGEVTYGHTE